MLAVPIPVVLERERRFGLWSCPQPGAAALSMRGDCVIINIMQV